MRREEANGRKMGVEEEKEREQGIEKTAADVKTGGALNREDDT